MAQVHTQKILEVTKLQNRFEIALRPEEMKTLRISVRMGNSAKLSDPPIYSGTVEVSFQRDGKMYSIREGKEYRGEKSSGMAVPLLSTQKGEFRLLRHDDNASASIDGVPTNVVTDLLYEITNKIGRKEY